MFTAEIDPIPGDIRFSLKISFPVWGAEVPEVKTFEWVVTQRKTAYEMFISHATDYLRWTSDYLYTLLQKMRVNYFDPTAVPYFGNSHKKWYTAYWLFLDSRDRVRNFPYSQLETAKSYNGKMFGELIPIYHFDQREEIKLAVAEIAKLSLEIVATIKKLHRESSIPALAD
nr:hypothetical protein [uncultured Fluviicola sp.]